MDRYHWQTWNILTTMLTNTDAVNRGKLEIYWVDPGWIQGRPGVNRRGEGTIPLRSDCKYVGLFISQKELKRRKRKET